MKRLLMALAVAGLLVAIAAPVTSAGSARIYVTSTAGPSQPLDMGTWTVTGNVQHVRGFVMLESGIWDSIYAAGPELNTINWDYNMATGTGAIWGSGVHTVTAIPGATWNCTFHMTFLGNPDSYAGKGVCQGAGPLFGWQWRVDLTAAPGGSTGTGYLFAPGS